MNKVLVPGENNEISLNKMTQISLGKPFSECEETFNYSLVHYAQFDYRYSDVKHRCFDIFILSRI